MKKLKEKSAPNEMDFPDRIARAEIMFPKQCSSLWRIKGQPGIWLWKCRYTGYLQKEHILAYIPTIEWRGSVKDGSFRSVRVKRLSVFIRAHRTETFLRNMIKNG